ncbi:MAG: hypothetical protein HY903_03620 [Deltaproteobacteria bacterium]|nr:hypothetical protein [Deltaproteobacteria bacterium]
MSPFTFLLLCAVTQDPAVGAAKLSPPTRLAVAVAEAVGARVMRLAVTFDAALADVERADAAHALERTRLFTLTDAALADATLSLTRVDPGVVLATVSAANGERLWVGQIDWPAVVDARDAVDADLVYARLLEYRRERLRVVPVTAALGAPPSYAGSRYWGAAEELPWYAGFGAGGPMAPTADDWLVVQGAADVKDELELALLWHDDALARRIEEARFWPRLYWIAGFLTGAAAAVPSGIYLVGSKNQDTRAVGMSLVTLGAVSAVLALFYDSAGPAHVLTPPEAQRKVDGFNEELRQRLRLSPADVEGKAAER